MRRVLLDQQVNTTEGNDAAEFLQHINQALGFGVFFFC